MEAALLSSDKQDWRTPAWLLDVVREMGPIALDPCASNEPAHNFAVQNLTKHYDGLKTPWTEVFLGEVGTVFVNSEYGRALPAWTDKCAEEAGKGCEIIQLTPNRPGVKWYRAAMAGSSAMCSLHGRLTFEGAPSCAPFPSALFYYGDRPYLFCHTFQGHGDVRLLS